MRPKRTWVEMNCPPRPLCFKGWVEYETGQMPSTFNWQPMDFPAGLRSVATGRLYYRAGWTALFLSDGTIYFADELLLFEEMLELICARFGARYDVKRDHSYE